MPKRINPDLPRRVDINVTLCPRCGGAHGKTEFRVFELGDNLYTHWAYCPATGEPLLLNTRQHQVHKDEPMQFLVRWLSAGPNASCANNPKFPEGQDVIGPGVQEGEPSCVCDIPYPAQGTGAWQVHCTKCNAYGVCRAGGNPSDPKTIRLACKKPAPAVDVINPPSQGPQQV